MDELSGFKDAPAELRRLELELVERADVMFTGGISLYEAKQDKHANIHAFPSSIDRSHFALARSAERTEPVDQAGVARPRIGFFGVIDERMNISLVDRCAQLMPEWQFMMIGPVVKIDPAALPRRSNIHWLGGRSYDELPAYLGGWDVGFMPFALNEATRYISPTKTPEFLAAGVPVVSTAIVDVVRSYGEQGLVEIAHDAADIASKARKLLQRPKAEWLTRVDAHLAHMSWDETWSSMRALIERAGPRSVQSRKALAAGAPVAALSAAGVAHV
jgi:glycosyltransferase involved in cell wall biosynthesis